LHIVLRLFLALKNKRGRWEWIRKPSPEPREVKLALAEIKRITSFLKLKINVEQYAIGIFNRARIGEKITEQEKLVDLAAPSVYLACEKHKLGFSDKIYEEAIGKKIKEIEANAESIKGYQNNQD
jgi:transcription initiation factor TFIIIB Brf1 subunit/transcription initiation factor TFIIB